MISLSMRKRARCAAGVAAGLEHGAQSRQRDSNIAPGGHRVEIRPHQLADAVAAQGSGEDEQFEQVAHPFTPEFRRSLPAVITSGVDRQWSEHSDADWRMGLVRQQVE